MCDPQSAGVRKTGGGLAMASPYGIGQRQPNNGRIRIHQ